MNDRRIEEMVKMAAEIESIEAEAEGRSAESAARPVVVGRLGWVGMLAAAACIGIGTVGAWGLWRQVSGARESLAVLAEERGPAPTAVARDEKITAPVEPMPIETSAAAVWGPPAPLPGEVGTPGLREVVLRSVPAAPFGGRGHGECSVMMVIVHDLRGLMRCVQVKEEDWNGRCATDLAWWELAAARPGAAETCAMTPSRQVLVLALSGPPGALPNTQGRADEVASCILGLPRTCDAEGACFQSAAANCLPPDVTFKVETVALR